MVPGVSYPDNGFAVYFRNQDAINAAVRKPSVSIVDSVDLRYDSFSTYICVTERYMPQKGGKGSQRAKRLLSSFSKEGHSSNKEFVFLLFSDINIAWIKKNDRKRACSEFV